jgi:hypothetical protein
MYPDSRIYLSATVNSSIPLEHCPEDLKTRHTKMTCCSPAGRNGAVLVMNELQNIFSIWF